MDRLYIKNGLDHASSVLDRAGINIELDSGNRIMVSEEETAQAEEILDNEDIDYELI